MVRALEQTAPVVRPLGDRLIVREIKEQEQTASGLFLPESAREGTQLAIITAKGPGPRSPYTAQTVEMTGLNVGDLVLLAQKVGQDILVGGEQLLAVREVDIIAVIELPEEEDA